MEKVENKKIREKNSRAVRNNTFGLLQFDFDFNCHLYKNNFDRVISSSFQLAVEELGKRR